MCCSHNSNEISVQTQRGRLRWTGIANTTSKVKNKITDSDTHYTIYVPSGHQGTEETLENMAWKVTPRLAIYLDKLPIKVENRNFTTAENTHCNESMCPCAPQQ